MLVVVSILSINFCVVLDLSWVEFVNVFGLMIGEMVIWVILVIGELGLYESVMVVVFKLLVYFNVLII